MCRQFPILIFCAGSMRQGRLINNNVFCRNILLRILRRTDHTLPVFTWRHIFPLAESRAEAALTVKPGTEGNLLNRNIRQFQKELGRVDPCSNQILMRGKPSLGSEHTGKMKRTHIGILCKLIESQRFTEMLINIGTGFLHHFEMRSCIAGICPCIKGCLASA